jgi:hypothetical protein
LGLSGAAFGSAAVDGDAVRLKPPLYAVAIDVGLSQLDQQVGQSLLIVFLRVQVEEAVPGNRPDNAVGAQSLLFLKLRISPSVRAP